MHVQEAGSHPSFPGPAGWFTGTARINPLFQPGGPARAAGLVLVQRDGGPIEEIRPGHVVWLEPGEKHWHDPSPKTAPPYVAIQESIDGKPADWMEHIGDQQYRAEPPPTPREGLE